MRYPKECPAFEVVKLSDWYPADYFAARVGEHVEGTGIDPYTGQLLGYINREHHGRVIREFRFDRPHVKPLTRAAREMLALVQS